VVFRIDDHIVLDVLNWLLVGNDFRSGNSWEWCEDFGDVAPPLLAKFLVPVDRNGHTVREAGLLLPAELSELRSIDCVSVVIEGAVMCVLDPLVELLLRRVRNVQVRKELRAQRQVGDLIVGANIVDLVHLALVQDRVESICRISSKQVSSRWGSVAMQNNGLSSL
jgi:hypothetical protein